MRPLLARVDNQRTIGQGLLRLDEFSRPGDRLSDPLRALRFMRTGGLRDVARWPSIVPGIRPLHGGVEVAVAGMNVVLSDDLDGHAEDLSDVRRVQLALCGEATDS